MSSDKVPVNPWKKIADKIMKRILTTESERNEETAQQSMSEDDTDQLRFVCQCEDSRLRMYKHSAH